MSLKCHAVHRLAISGTFDKSSGKAVSSEGPSVDGAFKRMSILEGDAHVQRLDRHLIPRSQQGRGPMECGMKPLNYIRPRCEKE